MWLKLCGGGLLIAVASVLLKGVKGETLPLQWASTVLLGGGVLLMLQPLILFLTELCQENGVDDMASLLLRGLGVALLTQLCADLCRQSGDVLLSSGVELAGRAELLLMCLPQLKELIQRASCLLDNV